MEVEDHPFDYKDFEGIIPKGQYGGGTVIIWDEGTYETPEADVKDKKAQEHSLTSQFFKGGMLFNLNGKKLKGQFALIKDAERDEKSWYLLKVKDKYASTSDVTKKEKSVVSGLTVEEMAENKEAKKWQSNRSRKDDTKESLEGINMALLEKGIKSPLSGRIEAMNCTLIKEPFNSPDWIYELKLDGYRIIAIKNKMDINLYSRKNLNYSKYYPAVIEALKER